MTKDKSKKSEPVKEVVDEVRRLRESVESARETIREIAEERGESK